MIALSIAYVATENLVTRELKPWRLALVFMFGLLHGLGFAGVLSELGLPRGIPLGAPDVQPRRRGRSADGDRRGVIVVSPFMNKGWYRPRVVIPACLLIAAIGIYWTVARLSCLQRWPVPPLTQLITGSSRSRGTNFCSR